MDVDDEEYNQTLSLYRNILGEKDTTSINTLDLRNQGAKNEKKDDESVAMFSDQSLLSKDSRNSMSTRNILVLDKRSSKIDLDKTDLLQKEMKMKKTIINHVLNQIHLKFASLIFVIHNETRNVYSTFVHELHTHELHSYDKIKLYPPNVTKGGDILSLYLICFITNSFRMRSHKYDIAKFECLTSFDIPFCTNSELHIVNFGSQTKYIIDLVTGFHNTNRENENENSYFIRCKYKRKNISSRLKSNTFWQLYHVHLHASILPFVTDLEDTLKRFEIETEHEYNRCKLTDYRDKLFNDIEKDLQEQSILYQKIIDCKSRLNQYKNELLKAEKDIEIFDNKWEKDLEETTKQK